MKSGVLDNGVVIRTEEGSPQGGPLSPLLANIYLNEFDWEYEKRGVPVIRYADDIVLLCKSQRAAERLLESSIRYLEGKLKLQVNREKSHIAKVNATKKFKFLGFAFSKGKEGLFIRVHQKSLLKAKNKLRELTRRNQGKNVRQIMKNVKQYMTGWLNYYGIASMKNRIEEIRSERGIRQEEFARQMGVSRQTISSLENGRYNPSILLAWKIAKFFGMTIEDVLIFEEE